MLAGILKKLHTEALEFILDKDDAEKSQYHRGIILSVLFLLACFQVRVEFSEVKLAGTENGKK